ncbi:MAG: aldo/keto reductase [Sedimentisphaerales bacterium]|nr:aldo/keto reductase [Sedimentisphaerales bacterium]
MHADMDRRKFITAATAGAGLLALNAKTLEAQTPRTSTMPLRPLGKMGWMISIVGFGAGSRYLTQKNLDVAERMIHRAVELGINYFDTGFSYMTGDVRESHLRYGRFLTPNYRDRIYLSSKLHARDAETAKRDFEQTLIDLKTDHLDVLHFHGVASSEKIDKILAKDGALSVYRKLKEEGSIRAIGVTGHDSRVIAEALRRIQPDCVMCPQNPAHANVRRGYKGLDFARDVTPYALEHGMGLLAMKTTAQNQLIGKGGVSAEQLVRYALSLPVAAAVIGMPTLEVVESNALIARTLKPMSDPERKKISQQLSDAVADGTLLYTAPGYRDGTWV